MTASSDLLDLTKQYLAAIERGATGDALAAFFTEDVVQEEFPNRLIPTGARRDLAAILDGAVRGQHVMSAQRYEILESLVDGDRVALEVQWTGTLAIPLGSIPAGGGDARPLRGLSDLPRRQDRPPAELRLLRAVVSGAVTSCGGTHWLKHLRTRSTP